jgi:anti-sigma regulatory factor (Ser/Thr protein kinase)
MEALLVERWLRGCEPISTLDEASVAVARELVRREAALVSMSEEDTARLVTCASELGHNQLRHARFGKIAVRRVVREGVAGVEIIAADEGEGIEDVEAMAPMVSRLPDAPSLGIGLSGVIELAGEVDFDVRLGEGTCVWARRFVSEVPHARTVAICGRPIDGERYAGDDAAFVRLEDGGLVIAVADGLGHGREAREAAHVAVECVVAHPERSPNILLEDVHALLAKTRGAVMAIARLDPTRVLDVSLAGNVAARTVGRREGVDRRYAGPSFTLGSPGRVARMRVETDSLGAHEMFLMFSDGVSSRLAIDAAQFSVPTIVAARRLLDAWSDRRDDALLALVR